MLDPGKSCDRHTHPHTLADTRTPALACPGETCSCAGCGRCSARSWVGAGAAGRGAYPGALVTGGLFSGLCGRAILEGRVERSSLEISPLAVSLSHRHCGVPAPSPECPLRGRKAPRVRGTPGDVGFRTGSSCLSLSKYLEEESAERAGGARAWRACRQAASLPGPCRRPRPHDPGPASPPQALFAVTAPA